MSADARLDAITLSALVSSKICHDLVNPVGALSSGLDVLNDPSMDDDSMQEAAIDLIRQSAEKSVALLKFARLAYGASGGYGAELSLDEARDALRSIFAWSKATLDWRIAPGQAPKETVKTLLILTQTAGDCVPRGGEVVVAGSDGEFEIRAAGPRVFLNDGVAAALTGEAAELMPKFAPLYLAGLMMRERGGFAVAGMEGDVAVMRFADPVAARASARETLTAG